MAQKLENVKALNQVTDSRIEELQNETSAIAGRLETSKPNFSMIRLNALKIAIDSRLQQLRIRAQAIEDLIALLPVTRQRELRQRLDELGEQFSKLLPTHNEDFYDPEVDKIPDAQQRKINELSQIEELSIQLDSLKANVLAYLSDEEEKKRRQVTILTGASYALIGVGLALSLSAESFREIG